MPMAPMRPSAVCKGSPKKHLQNLVSRHVDQAIFVNGRTVTNKPKTAKSRKARKFNEEFPLVVDSDFSFMANRTLSRAASLPKMKSVKDMSKTFSNRKSFKKKKEKTTNHFKFAFKWGADDYEGGSVAQHPATSLKAEHQNRAGKIRLESVRCQSAQLRSQIRARQEEQTHRERIEAEREQLRSRAEEGERKRRELHQEAVDTKIRVQKELDAHLDEEYVSISGFWSTREDESYRQLVKAKKQRPQKSMSEIILAAPINVLEADFTMIDDEEAWRAKQKAVKVEQMRERTEKAARMEEMLAYYEEKERQDEHEQAQKEKKLSVLAVMAEQMEMKKRKNEMLRAIALEQETEARKIEETKALASIRARARFGSLSDIPKDYLISAFEQFDTQHSGLVASHSLRPLLKVIVDYYWDEVKKSGMNAIRDLRNDLTGTEQNKLFDNIFKLPSTSAKEEVYKEVEQNLRLRLGLQTEQSFSEKHFVDEFVAFTSQLDKDAASRKDKEGKKKRITGAGVHSFSWGYTSAMARSKKTSFVGQTFHKIAEKARHRTKARHQLRALVENGPQKKMVLRQTGYGVGDKYSSYDDFALRLVNGEVVIVGDGIPRKMWQNKLSKRPSTTISERKQVTGGRLIPTNLTR